MPPRWPNRQLRRKSCRHILYLPLRHLIQSDLTDNAILDFLSACWTQRQRIQEDRPSTAVETSLIRQPDSCGRPSESFTEAEHIEGTGWTQDRADLRDSVIGVATTTSVPASSSKTAVAPVPYPKFESPRPIPSPNHSRPVSLSAGTDVGRLMMSELDDAPAVRPKVSSFQKSCLVDTR